MIAEGVIGWLGSRAQRDSLRLALIPTLGREQFPRPVLICDNREHKLLQRSSREPGHVHDHLGNWAIIWKQRQELTPEFRATSSSLASSLT